MITNKRIFNKGFSMIEVLVILVAIPIIAVISTQSLINILSSQRKIDTEIQVRGNIEHVFSFVERRILNAIDLTVTYPNATTTILTYTNISGTVGRFGCTTSPVGSGKIEHEEIVGDGYVRLSDGDIDIYKCVIVQTGGVDNITKGIRMVVGGKAVGQEGAEGGQIELTTIVHTRSY